MKKFGIFMVVFGVVIAVAVPALAFTIEGAKGEKMYIGGIFATDIGYWSRSKELIAGSPGNNTLSDRTEFFLAVPTNSRLRGTVEVGNVGGYWEFGMGGNEINTTATDATNQKYVETRKLYGWYQFGNCELLAGKTDGHIYSFQPLQVIGQSLNSHTNGYGWGSIYDQRNPQVRFTQNITKQFGYQISLVQPMIYFDTAITTTALQKSYAALPLIAAKVMMSFGPVSLKPAFAYQNVKWDNVPSGFDDNMTSWYGVIPVVVKVGGFTGTVQGGYGLNLGNGSGIGNGILQYQSTFHQYFRDASGKIKDTTGMNAFIDLAYTFGPATPHIYFGYDNAKNSDKWKVGDDNNTRLMYGISMQYKVANSFFVVPEFTYYDYGKQPGLASRPDVGKEWLGGVQFQFVF